jgi:hypothetical protein
MTRDERLDLSRSHAEVIEDLMWTHAHVDRERRVLLIREQVQRAMQLAAKHERDRYPRQRDFA